ncbi:uncharacterized protein LOC132608330 [Lycium barbarum]|uniref:uncharacterized protein LOC132608330 n=1 Tax=Lycium barbarum TaxID=112863 RepID=UPI00293F6731|nr:uncharacterized protein LOC132608330 [Lycium barbarum]
MTCNNAGCPRWVFVLYLIIQGKLYTRDRLLKWGMINDQTCPICEATEESIQHLFFECPTSSYIWCKILKWQGYTRQAMSWHNELQWAVNFAANKGSKAEVYRMALAATVYYIWQLRNNKVFQNPSRTGDQVVRLIIQDVLCRANTFHRLARMMVTLNFYP